MAYAVSKHADLSGKFVTFTDSNLRMRLFISLFLSVCCVQFAVAQSVPQYTNFNFNQMVTNPAVSGARGNLDLTLLYRGQWIGVEGAPSTQFFSGHAPINRISSGVGLTVVNDMMGAQRTTLINMAYAYRLNRRWGKLAFGAGVGVYQTALDGTQLISPTGRYDNGTINHNDNLIPDSRVSGISPEVQLGIYYNSDNIYAGLAVYNVLGSKIILDAPGGSTEIRKARGYIFSAGYNIELNRTLNLLPNAMVKTDLRNYQTDINLLVMWKDNLHGGLAFRGSSRKTVDALSALLGFKLFKSLRIGYSYDFSLSSLNNVNTGSHEVFLKYELAIKDKSKPGKVIHNPRFL